MQQRTIITVWLLNWYDVIRNGKDNIMKIYDLIFDQIYVPFMGKEVGAEGVVIKHLKWEGTE